jgi:hypothetical protein
MHAERFEAGPASGGHMGRGTGTRKVARAPAGGGGRRLSFGGAVAAGQLQPASEADWADLARMVVEGTPLDVRAVAEIGARVIGSAASAINNAACEEQQAPMLQKLRMKLRSLYKMGAGM